MIYFLGDVHGQFDHILRFLDKREEDRDAPCSLIFLGDIESPHPFEEMIRPFLDLGADVWFIHGNHDTDHNRHWDHLQDSQHRNLDGRVVTIEGLKVCGLGGIFRGEIWYPGMKCDEEALRLKPPVPKNYQSYADYEDSFKAARQKNPTLFTNKLLKHKSSIFPDSLESLAKQTADILVSHEAPDGHPHGFTELGLLAKAMGVKHYFHGHQHDNRNYADWNEQTGIQLRGVGYRGITSLKGEVLVPGTMDHLYEAP